MSLHENAQVDVNVNGKSAQKQLSALQKSAEKYKKELVQANKAGDLKGYKKAKKNLDGVNKEMRQLKKQTFDVNKVVKNLSTATYNDLRKSARKLNKELNNMERNTKQYAAKKKQLAAVRGEMSKHRNELRKTNKLWSNMKGILPALGIGAAVAMVGRLIGKWARWQEQLRKSRHQIQTLTDATGSMLDELTAKVDATAKTFDQDFNEVATAANTLSKQMNISFGHAMELIQDGFAAGADNSGEFLSMLKEYPTQLQQIGVDADQAVALMTQQVKEGVFSDKGIDAIKEAGIRLREMTKPTQEAIEGIGLTVDQVDKVIGEEGIIGGIKLVSKQLNTLEDNSPEVGAAIADIFAGPGEDAGLEYLKTLKDIDGSMEDLQGEASKYAKQQERLVEANERVSESMSAVFGSGSVWTQIKISFKEWWADILEKIRAVPLGLNRIGKALGFDVKPLTDFRDTVIQSNPELRKLADRVEKFGINTKKGKEEMDKLAEALINAYGDEGVDLAKQFTKEQYELAKQRIKNSEQETETVEKTYKQMHASLKEAHEQRKLELQQQYTDQKITTEQFHTEMLLEEQAYLQSKRALQQKQGQNTIEISQKIAKNEREIAQLNRSAFEMQQEDMNAFLDKVNSDYEEQMQWLDKRDEQAKDKLIQNTREWSQKQEQEMRAHNKKEQQIYEQKLSIAQDVASQLGSVLGQAVADGNMTLEDAGRQMLIILLDQLKVFMKMQVAKATMASIATMGIAGLARAAVLTGLIEAAFAGVKAAVMSAGKDKDSGGSTVKQRAAGTLDVIGEEDGKTYNNVPYQGEVSGVGIVNQGRPTLINEEGGELIVPAHTTERIRLQAPELIDMMKAYQVPQRAAGNVPETTGGSDITEELRRSRETNMLLAQEVQKMREQGIRAMYGDDEILQNRDRMKDFDEIENDASWE